MRWARTGASRSSSARVRRVPRIATHVKRAQPRPSGGRGTPSFHLAHLQYFHLLGIRTKEIRVTQEKRSRHPEHFTNYKWKRNSVIPLFKLSVSTENKLFPGDRAIFSALRVCWARDAKENPDSLRLRENS